MKRLRAEGVELVIYEPTLQEDEFQKMQVEHDFEVFKQRADVIVANRLSDELMDVKDKVYTRDVYSRD